MMCSVSVLQSGMSTDTKSTFDFCSRAMNSITDSPHQQLVQHFRQLYSTYQQNRDLINVGAYQQGSDSSIDQAILMNPQLMEFLAQNMNQAVDSSNSLTQLRELLEGARIRPTSEQAVANAEDNESLQTA